MTGIVERLRHHGQPSLSPEPYEAIAQVFSIDEHEGRKDDYDSGDFEWPGDRAEQSAQVLDEIRWRRGHLNGNRLRRMGGSL